MTRGRHDLDPEDAKVWRHVTRSVRPLRGTPARHPTPDETSVEPPPRLRNPTIVRPNPVLRQTPALPAPLNLGAVADMDRRAAQRLKRGEMRIDGRIDLHGLTLDQAHGALAAFIRGAYGRGARCLVVVTGKGTGQARGEQSGKIRYEVPHWLNQPALRPLVLAVAAAGRYDGGDGALYVLLKRVRG